MKYRDLDQPGSFQKGMAEAHKHLRQAEGLVDALVRWPECLWFVERIREARDALPLDEQLSVRRQRRPATVPRRHELRTLLMNLADAMEGKLERDPLADELDAQLLLEAKDLLGWELAKHPGDRPAPSNHVTTTRAREVLKRLRSPRK